jgi:hypothetical protein
MGTERTRVWRGGAVGALTATLAVAAHGVGGGGVPTSSALSLLLAVAIGAGVLAAGVGTARTGPLPILLWLVGGQVVAHEALAAVAEHAHPLDASMLAAHAVAVGVGAVLVASSERLFAAITSVLRAPRLTFSPPRRPRPVTATAPLDRPVPVPVLSAVSRRGPPQVLVQPLTPRYSLT